MFFRQLVVGLSTLLATFILGAVALYWLNLELRTQTNGLLQSRALLQNKVSQTELSGTLKSQKGEAAQYEEGLRKLLPTKDDLINYPSWFEAVGRRNGVDAYLSFEGTARDGNKEKAGEVSVNVVAIGSWENVTRFLKSLEAEPSFFMIKVNNFDLSSSGNGFRLTGKGIVYFETPEA